MNRERLIVIVLIAAALAVTVYAAV